VGTFSRRSWEERATAGGCAEAHTVPISPRGEGWHEIRSDETAGSPGACSGIDLINGRGAVRLVSPDEPKPQWILFWASGGTPARFDWCRIRTYVLIAPIVVARPRDLRLGGRPLPGPADAPARPEIRRSLPGHIPSRTARAAPENSDAACRPSTL